MLHLRQFVVEYKRRLDAGSLTVPLVGICFGHQLIGHSLGGLTTRNPYQPGGWRFCEGSAAVELDPAIYEQAWARAAAAAFGRAPSRFIHKSHGDAVARLPPGARLWGKSAECGVEVYTLGDRILCFQGHPELLDMYCERHARELRDLRVYSDADVQATLDSLRQHPPERDFWRALIVGFLQQQQPS